MPSFCINTEPEARSKGSVMTKKERIGVRVTKDRRLEEGIFEPQERGLMTRKPLPSHIFLGYGEEGLNDVGEIGNELAIEIAEVHE